MTHIPKTMNLRDGEITATVRAINHAHGAIHKVVSKYTEDIDDETSAECMTALAELEAIIQHVFGSLSTPKTKEVSK